MSGDLDYRIPRPATVTIAGIITLVPAIATVGFILFSMAFFFTSMSRGLGLVAIPFLLIGLVMNMIIPGLLAMVGIGLLRLRPWARTTGVVVSAVACVVILGQAFVTRSITWQSGFGLFPVVTIALLLAPSAREAFAEAREQQNL